MSLFSSLFKNNNNTNQNESSPELKTTPITMSPKLHLRGTPDANGLYPSELVMLAVAEKYRTTDTNFPSYLTTSYEIANPPKMLINLQTRGYLDVGSAKDSLDYFKLPELKEISSLLGITPKGKKADIISAISQIDEETLSQHVKERKWKLTDAGESALRANPYIEYFLGSHTYNTTSVGVDIWTINEEYVKNPTRPFRDLIYRQLNEQMNKAFIAFQKAPTSGSSNTYQYCECYRIMGLFVEEEGKSFVNASDLYFQYIFKRINIHAGMQLLVRCKLFENDKKHQSELINQYYDEIQLYPFQKTELLRLIDELNIEGDAVREALIASFKRTNDTGIMNEREAADFVVFELNGEGDRSRDLAEKLAKKAIKKMR